MDSSKQSPAVSVEEAVLKAKVAQICHSVGYNAITQDSSNVLVDIYRRTILHLARHCKDAANNNRRVEPTLIDLVQAYDFVGISIPELQEHIETVKLPLDIELIQDEPKPSNRIQRNLLVDDLLEAEKNSHLEDQEEGDNKAPSENGVDEDEKPTVPLLKDTYEEISSKFTNCTPVTADKKIIFVLAKTKLKIAPLPEPAPTTSGTTGKLGKKKKKKETEKKKTSENPTGPTTPVKQTRGRGKKKKKLSREFVPPDHSPEKELEPSLEEVVLPEEQPCIKVEEEPILEPEPEPEKPKEKEREKEKDKSKSGKRSSTKKNKTPVVTPLDPAVAEPPSFFPIIDVKPEPIVPTIEHEPLPPPSPIPKPPKEVKSKRKKRSSDELVPPIESTSPVEDKAPSKSKSSSKKKLKTTSGGAVTPLDPSIAEPPSFFPILEIKKEEPVAEEVEPIIEQSSSKTKQQKGKKKKKSKDQEFAIVTETVTASEEQEWHCPGCGGPDDGMDDLMVQCDVCQEWYHLRCTGLKKPPEDDENWECSLCAKARTQKRPQTPIVGTIKLKTPEPPAPTVTISTTPLPIATPTPPLKPPVVVATTSGSQDDLCPECSLPDDGTMMIQCDDPDCAKWFHGKCVSLLEEPKEDESWFCKQCVDKQQSAFKRRRRPK